MASCNAICVRINIKHFTWSTAFKISSLIIHGTTRWHPNSLITPTGGSGASGFQHWVAHTDQGCWPLGQVWILAAGTRICRGLNFLQYLHILHCSSILLFFHWLKLKRNLSVLCDHQTRGQHGGGGQVNSVHGQVTFSGGKVRWISRSTCPLDRLIFLILSCSDYLLMIYWKCPSQLCILDWISTQADLIAQCICWIAMCMQWTWEMPGSQ